MEEILLILTLLRAKNFQGANRNQQYQAKFLGVLRKKKHVLSHIGITAMESTFLCYLYYHICVASVDAQLLNCTRKKAIDKIKFLDACNNNELTSFGKP